MYFIRRIAFAVPLLLFISLLAFVLVERISHRRHVIDFVPFRHDDLADSIRAAGFTVKDDSYQEDGSFYAIAATAS